MFENDDLSWLSPNPNEKQYDFDMPIGDETGPYGAQAPVISRRIGNQRPRWKTFLGGAMQAIGAPGSPLDAMGQSLGGRPQQPAPPDPFSESSQGQNRLGGYLRKAGRTIFGGQ